MEESSLSYSRLEAELQARLVVAQSSLDLDIASYNRLKSKYFTVINRAADFAK